MGRLEEEVKNFTIEELAELVVEFNQQYIDENSKIRELSSKVYEKRVDKVTWTEMLHVISAISLMLAEHILKK